MSTWGLIPALIRRGWGRLMGRQFAFPVIHIWRAFREPVEPWDL